VDDGRPKKKLSLTEKLNDQRQKKKKQKKNLCRCRGCRAPRVAIVSKKNFTSASTCLMPSVAITPSWGRKKKCAAPPRSSAGCRDHPNFEKKKIRTTYTMSQHHPLEKKKTVQPPRSGCRGFSRSACDFFFHKTLSPPLAHLFNYTANLPIPFFFFLAANGFARTSCAMPLVLSTAAFWLAGRTAWRVVCVRRAKTSRFHAKFMRPFKRQRILLSASRLRG
jgi:hypothetical protein